MMLLTLNVAIFIGTLAAYGTGMRRCFKELAVEPRPSLGEPDPLLISDSVVGALRLDARTYLGMREQRDRFNQIKVSS